MHSIIIASQDKKLREDYALKMCQEQGVGTFDITVLDFAQDEKKISIGIEDIRTIQKSLLLRPLVGELKAIIISDAHTLTIEAQNALLKILEEPPPHVSIILTLPHIKTLLPTICSRCQILELGSVDTSSSPQESDRDEEIIRSLNTKMLATTLKYAQDVSKNRNESLIWIEKSIRAIRSHLLEEIMKNNTIDKKYIHIIKQLQSAHILLSTTNTNPRLIIENTLINL